LSTRPHTARPGHPLRLKSGTLAGPLPTGDCSEYVLAMLAEGRFTIPPGPDIQPFAMMSVMQLGREQDVPQESRTRGTPLESFGRLRLNRSVPSSVLSRFRPDPSKTDHSTGHTLERQCITMCTTVSMTAPQSLCQRRTLDLWCLICCRHRRVRTHR